MKKTLKLVGIFAAVLVIGFAGGLAGYFLIQSNKTYYIYDLRIVEPIPEANAYVYLNKEREYTNLKNQTLYMTSEKENRLQIAVFASTSIDTRSVDIVSSNNDVADIVYEDGRCYVRYKKAGEAKITASIADVVTDSIDIYVYNQPAEDVAVYDYRYYGTYANVYTNNVKAYADDLTYTYDFVANSVFSDSDNDIINSDLLSIDTNSVNTDVFSKVEIDPVAKKLVLQCKSSLNETLIDNQRTDIDESIVIQSYYYSAEGEVKPSKRYVVNVNVIADTPEFLQVVLATTPDFSDNCVFMDTVDYTDATETKIMSNIEEFLSYQKAEGYLANNGENSVYQTFFTDRVSDIYLKFRKVYTNGDIVYLNPKTENDSDDPHPYTITCDGGYLTLSQNKEYYVLKIDRTYFEDAGGAITRKFNINLKLDDFINFEADFEFEFKEFNETNVLDFYKFIPETKSFEYKYWDERTRYYNEICDKNGLIIGFGGVNIDIDSLMPPETSGE